MTSVPLHSWRDDSEEEGLRGVVFGEPGFHLNVGLAAVSEVRVDVPAAWSVFVEIAYSESPQINSILKGKKEGSHHGQINRCAWSSRCG